MEIKSILQRRPVTSYFCLTFTISWLGAFILVAPKILNGQNVPKMDGIMMFPIMLLGPVAAGLILTGVIKGKSGIRALISRISKGRVQIKWYLISICLPPALMLILLFSLSNFLSRAYAPNFFLLGFLFGIPAGFFEEIGWSGFAFPQLRSRYGFLKSAILLGTLWSLWHLPVIDFLGAASPHGKYLPLFALSFFVAMSAMRVIICWIYSNTGSILLTQIAHTVSTGALVIFGPEGILPKQEAFWYLLYGVLLWITVAIIMAMERAKRYGNRQTVSPQV